MPALVYPPLSPLRPFLKWPGGKTRILKNLLPHLSPNKILVEPFVGAGSVFLNTPFEHYILNDINPDLINLFKLIKQDPKTFSQAAQKLFIPEYNCPKIYYQFRAHFNRTTHIFERALLFLYLNKHGYNGLCRYNAAGGYNVPFGSYQKVSFPEAAIYGFAQKSIDTYFTQLSFENFFEWLSTHHDPKNLTIYCDPPYAPLSATANFTGYASQKFTLAHQQQLADFALKLSDRSAKVIISNHDTEFTRELYKNADIIPLKVQRGISCKATSRGKANELLAIYGG